jgi:hypothetical protein
MTFNPATFKTATDRHAGFGNHLFWGGGHTSETYDAIRSWKARIPQKGSQLLLVGQKGVPGCATLLHLKRNKDMEAVYGVDPNNVDVAVYCETPEEIRTSLANDEVTDAVYHQLPNISGIGLLVVRLIEDYRADMAAMRLRYPSP